MKSVTFSADHNLIQQARLVARSQGKTLNHAFREWLQEYATQPTISRDFDSLMKSLRHVNAGRHFTREEMNEDYILSYWPFPFFAISSVSLIQRRIWRWLIFSSISDSSPPSTLAMNICVFLPSSCSNIQSCSLP